jgi:hypothetical protein
MAQSVGSHFSPGRGLAPARERLAWATMAVLAFLLVCLASCARPSGPAKKICYPVQGELTIKGKPVPGALVVFRPQGDANAEEWSAGFPRAYVGEDGKFTVGTYTDDDGAPAGDYLVLVSWDLPNPQNEEGSSTDKLAGRYSDPSTSKLTAKVNAGPTQLPPIQLP